MRHAARCVQVGSDDRPRCSTDRQYTVRGVGAGGAVAGCNALSSSDKRRTKVRGGGGGGWAKCAFLAAWVYWCVWWEGIGDVDGCGADRVARG